MVMRFERIRTMKEAFGASPYGGDLNKWPSREVDAFIILQQEHQRVENMMYSTIPKVDQQIQKMRKSS